MANIKISELAAAASLTGTEQFPVVQGGATVRTTIGALVDSIIINALDHGAVADGTTDNAAALQALIDSSNTSYLSDGVMRVIYCPPGRYRTRSALLWKSGVGLVGAGPQATRFLPYNAGPLASGFSLIKKIDGSLSDVTTDVLFKDFEIDGSGITLTGYDVGSKGINILWMNRARFENLYIHDTVATGIGCDNLRDSFIVNNLLVGCGRMNNGTQAGGAGIGIGIGDYSIEQLVIEGNTCRNNGTHGIFVEHQHGSFTAHSRGIRIVGNHCEGNVHGISDWGADGLLVANNTLIANTTDGFNVGNGVAGTDHVGRRGLLVGNIITDNLGDGVAINDCDVGRYAIRGNKITGNSAVGVALRDPNTAVTQPLMVIENNEIAFNGLSGIYLGALTSSITLSGNRIYSNGTNTGAASPRAGILIDANPDHPTIWNNRCHDNQGTKTQTHGIYFSAAAGTPFSPVIFNNDFNGNLTSATFLPSGWTGSPFIRNNAGWDPNNNGSTLSAVTVGASPFTYTAGPTPETLFIDPGVATISALTFNGMGLPPGNSVLPLEERDVIVVTYSGGTPTMKSRLR